MPTIYYSVEICASLLNATAFESQQHNEDSELLPIWVLLLPFASTFGLLFTLWGWLYLSNMFNFTLDQSLFEKK